MLTRLRLRLRLRLRTRLRLRLRLWLRLRWAREHLAHASDSQITEEIGTASAEGLARHVPTGFTR